MEREEEGGRREEGRGRRLRLLLCCQIVPATRSKTVRNTFDHNHPPLKLDTKS